MHPSVDLTIATAIKPLLATPPSVANHFSDTEIPCLRTSIPISGAILARLCFSIHDRLSNDTIFMLGGICLQMQNFGLYVQFITSETCFRSNLASNY